MSRRGAEGTPRELEARNVLDFAALYLRRAGDEAGAARLELAPVPAVLAGVDARARAERRSAKLRGRRGPLDAADLEARKLLGELILDLNALARSKASPAP